MAANDNVVGCASGSFDWKTLLASCIGKDLSGKATLRVYDSNAVAGSNFFTCGVPASNEAINAAMAALITLDSNGDIALRVSIP